MGPRHRAGASSGWSGWRLAGPRAAAAWLACLACAAACTKKDPEPTPAPSVEAAPSAASVEPSAAPSAPVAAPAGDGGAEAVDPSTPVGALNLTERFAREAQSRPAGAVRAEDVFEAFKAAGATFEPPKQHLGSFFKANYCVGAKNPDTAFVIDLCEYADAKAAKEGKAMSLKSLAAITGRQLYLNGATLLTLRLGKETPENLALAKKLAAVFAKLKPAPAPAASSSAKGR
jgi:hypothetical protein